MFISSLLFLLKSVFGQLLAIVFNGEQKHWNISILVAVQKQNNRAPGWLSRLSSQFLILARHDLRILLIELQMGSLLRGESS